MRKFLALGLILTAFTIGRAQPLTSNADFLLMAPAARPDSLGQAFCAVADDVNTVAYNPAGLGLLRRPEAGYSRQEYVQGVRFDFIGIAIPLGVPGVAAFAYQGLSVEPFNSTADPEIDPVTVGERMVLFAWGRSFGRIQGGGAIRRVVRNLDGWKEGGLGIDGGLRWAWCPRGSLGAVVQNAGPLLEETEPGPYPLIARAGAAYRLLEDPRYRLEVTTDLTGRRNDRGIRAGGGLEYSWRETAFIRAGWAADRRASEQAGASFGAGLRWSGFQLDYSIRPFASLGAAHRISGGFRWGGSWIPEVVPAPPDAFRVVEIGGEAWILWRPVRQEHLRLEIVRTDLDTGRAVTMGPYEVASVLLVGSEPGRMYRVVGRTVSPGGRRSLPSEERYYSLAGSSGEGSERVPLPEPIQEVASPTPTPNRVVQAPAPTPTSTRVFPPIKPLEGEFDALGMMRIEWSPLKDVQTAGYLVYRKDPTGSTRRLNRVPIPVMRAWFPEAETPQGSTLLVTAVRPDGTELIVGAFTCRVPDEWDRARGAGGGIPVKVTGAGEGRVVVWTGDLSGSRIRVLFSEGAGGPFWTLGETKGRGADEVSAILSGMKGYFMLIGLDERGKWVSRTDQALWK